MISETDFIENYLKPLCTSKASLNLSDDTALLNTDLSQDIIISKDMSIGGHHFFEDDDPSDIAYKALAVNLSDLAAKGAKPFAYMLGIAFPKSPDETWAKNFTKSLKDVMDQFDLILLGGDTTGTKGPLVISVTIFGKVEKGRMVKRSGAKIGDKVFVSGTLGDAALGFQIRSAAKQVLNWPLNEEEKKCLLKRYLRPTPRCNLSNIIKNHASSSMDLSDGLIADLEKLCTASNTGAVVRFDKLPLSNSAKKVFEAAPNLKTHCLGWGDDYEILATIPENNHESFSKALKETKTPMTYIGDIQSAENGIIYIKENGEELALKGQNFSHF